MLGKNNSTAVTTAENFIEQHGKAKFLRLIEMFQANESGPKIAFEFHVTRQRIHQLKVTLGEERILFILRPEVEAIIGAPGSGRKTV